MTNTKSIMVATVMIAIAAVAMMPLMSSSAFADYGYAKTNLTDCNYSAWYKTHVSQTNAGDEVFVQIQVPSTVCDNSFSDAEVTIEDGNGVTCDYEIDGANSSVTQDCGDFDLGTEPLNISVSIDYGNHNVSYDQTDNTT